MGFFATLGSKFSDLKAGLDQEIAKMKGKDAVQASLAIVALVAGADGEIEKEEVKAGADFVRKGDLFQAHDRAALADALNGYYTKATDAILKEDLFDVIRKVKSNADVARSVVKVGIAIARSDGDFEVQEKEVLVEVCEALNLDPASFKGLV